MKKVTAIISDMHYHAFSAFSSTTPDGMNTRLIDTLSATQQAVDDLIAAGGDTLYCGGDTFHVRGSLKPSVLNPVIDLYRGIVERGIKVRMLAGNHDLESKASSQLTNAASALAAVGVEVVSEPTVFHDDKVIMLPWVEHKKDLLDAIAQNASAVKAIGHELSDYTLIIHAPMNNVIRGIPDTGIDATQLDTGWGSVFCGHYHNHKKLTDRVYSIGALTHQTWGDVDTEAGYVLVQDHQVEHRNTKAPRFIDFVPHWDDQEALDYCEGNFVRVKLGPATEKEILKIRDSVTNDYRALGVIVQATPVSNGVTRTASIEAGASMIQSLKEWIDTNDQGVDPDKLLLRCEAILNETEEAA